MATIGIDLGTTFSCVAAFIRDKIEIIPNGVGNNTTPSVVAFKEDDEIVVGETAMSEGIRVPRNTIFDIKRMIGKRLDDPKIQEYSKIWPFQITEENGEVAVVVDGKNYAPKFVSSQILGYLKEHAKTFLNAEVKQAVVTVPAYFTEAQKSITTEACKDAGLEIIQLITEPTAAAISYYCKSGKIEGERTCLIFDLGGGTLDLAVVTYKDNNIKIIQIGGDPNLGGEDFDNTMVEYCIEEFKKEHQIDLRRPQCSLTNVDPERVARDLRRLKIECQKQKCFLSSSVRKVVAGLNAIHGELDLVVPITREIFEELNESKFQRCLTLVKQTLERCGLRKEEIDDIVLVGGSTRIPRVQQLLKEYFGKKLTRNINADEAVAFGAAMQAHYLVNADSLEATTFHPVIEYLDFPMFEDKFQFQQNSPKGCANCAKKMEELLGELAEVNLEVETLRKNLSMEREKSSRFASSVTILEAKVENHRLENEKIEELIVELTETKVKLHQENETLRKDLSTEREKSSKLASSLTILEGKMEELMNPPEKERLTKKIPTGLLSFQNTEEWAVAVVLKNSTSTRFLHPNKWYRFQETREYFPMPLEIPPLSQDGFGFTCKRGFLLTFEGLFSFQIDETRFVVMYRVFDGYNSVGLAFVPPNYSLDKSLCKGIRSGTDWSNLPDKCKVYVSHYSFNGQKEKIEAHLQFGRICAEATMTIGEQSVLNVEIKSIPK